MRLHVVTTYIGLVGAWVETCQTKKKGANDVILLFFGFLFKNIDIYVNFDVS